MTLRTGHGNGAGVPRVEVLPADELPVGVPAPARAASPCDRGDRGRLARGNSLASLGGKARKGSTALACRIGVASLVQGDAFGPYKKLASTFRRVHCSSMASTVGGGVCGSGPSSMVASAALALAASRFLYDTAGGDPTRLAQASKLANDSRQNLLAAHELCAREALARPRLDPIAALTARLEAFRPPPEDSA